MQRISIRDLLNDFMQVHSAEQAAALAPELMNYSGQHSAVQRCVMQHSVDYLREALQCWLVAGEKINYSVQDNYILTALGFRPDAVSRDDNREKFTPAQNLNYTRRRAELAVQ
ncbi:phage polarity suppression protein [Klebsiella pneumoniae]|nr:phage polarity suppression protein [Klebsiella pneumoniae]SVV56901.1 phage polarity suppression protein [Klebsiella pneumoniae]SVY64659.1 phage polarity suppression protein [Klebsiella pneumoniae]SWG74352.1 phage polarity suppression protein [Klebsiella pneumoniae]SWR42011.1 phage polarity suppression protein [Klebsiella pneumoniae]